MRDVLEGVLRRLALLPPSPDRDVLRARVGDYLQQAHGWRYSHPTRHEREALLRRVLALAAEVAGLEQTMVASRPAEAAI